MLGDHGRLRKGIFYESSLRIPLLIRWPGRIPANAVTDALVENIDVFPTLVEAAGFSATAWCAGKSLWPLLRGETSNVRQNQLSETGRALSHVMLRTPEYKFAVDGTGRAYMLFDLVHDPEEQHNLVGDASAMNVESSLRHELQHRLEHSRYAK